MTRRRRSGSEIELARSPKARSNLRLTTMSDAE
jgi:hypothetical protein